MKMNQLKSGVILSYISLIANMLIQLLYTPIILRLLGQNEFGLYQLVASVVGYLSILSFGINGSYVRFYSRYNVLKDSNGIAVLNGMFIVIFSVIAFICMVVGGILVYNTNLLFEKSLTALEIQRAKILMMILIINMMISFPVSVLDSFIIANEKYIFQRLLGLFRIVCPPLLTLPLLMLGYKSVALVSCSLVVTIFSALINIFYVIKKLRMKFNFKKFDMDLFNEIFSFSFFIFLNIIFDQINWSTDKFLLGMFSGTISVAVYGIASQLNNMFINFSTVISSVFTPRINNWIAEGKHDSEITALFVKVGRIQFIVLAYILLNFLFLGKYFIVLWAGQDYINSYYILLCLTIPSIIPLIQNLGIEIQRAKNKHQFRSIVYSFIAILNILVSIPLIKNFDGLGAAIGTAVTLFLGTGLIMNWFYYKKLNIDIVSFWKSILTLIKALFIPIIISTIFYVIVGVDNIIKFIILGILLLLSYIFSMWMLGLNNDEKELIKGLLRIKHVP